MWIFLIILMVGVTIGVTFGLVVDAKKRRLWAARQIDETDEAFLEKCDIPSSELARSIAMTMRRFLAHLGHVPPTSLSAAVKCQAELGEQLNLDYADILDMKARTERHLDIAIPKDKWAEHVRELQVPPNELEFRHLIQTAILVAQVRTSPAT